MNTVKQDVKSIDTKTRRTVWFNAVLIVMQVALTIVFSILFNFFVNEKNRELYQGYWNQYVIQKHMELENLSIGYAQWEKFTVNLRQISTNAEMLAYWKSDFNKNDFAVVFLGNRIKIAGGRHIDSILDQIEGSPQIIALYKSISLAPTFESNAVFIHLSNATLLLFASPLADDSGRTISEGMMINGFILERQLTNLSTMMFADVSIDNKPSGASPIVISDSIQKNRVRYLNIYPKVNIQQMVFSPLAIMLLVQIGLVLSIVLSFNSLMGSILQLYEELCKQNEKLQNELELAAHLQKGLLPENSDVTRKASFGTLAFKFSPANFVSGDVYDFVANLDQQWLILMSITGSGVPVALLTNFAITAFRDESRKASGPSELLSKLAAKLTGYLPNKTYISAICVKIENRTLCFSTAGSEEALFYNPDEQKIRQLYSSSPMLGMQSQNEWKDTTLDFPNGASLLLFGEQLIKLPISQTEHLGRERLTQIFQKHLSLSPQVIVDNIYTELEQTIAREIERTDITLLCIRK